MRPGDGITGTAAVERRPVAIAANAHLDPRWMEFPNLPESEYESILAVPILAREQLAGALNVRTREAREFRPDEIELLQAIAGQVAQSIVHAQLYAEAQRRVAELEALARISEAVSESLYLEESLEAIVKTTMDAVQQPAPPSCSRTDGSPGRKGAPAPTPCGRPCAGSGGRSAGSWPTAIRPSLTRSGRCSRRSPTTRPSRSSTGAR